MIEKRAKQPEFPDFYFPFGGRLNRRFFALVSEDEQSGEVDHCREPHAPAYAERLVGGVNSCRVNHPPPKNVRAFQRFSFLNAKDD